MTVNQAVFAVQKRKPGFINRMSVNYAQTLLQENESVRAAVIANIYTKRDNYPGVVVLSDRNIMAVCGLPGAKRKVILPIDQLERCEEISTVIQYKATFRTHRDTFSMSIDPDDGEAFSAYIAEINGEEFEDIRLDADGKILNPNLLRSRKRNQIRKEHQKARSLQRDIARQKKAAERFDSGSKNT